MANALFKVFMIIIAINVFTLGVLVLFLINTRVNIKRRILEKQFYLKTLAISNTANSTKAAAQALRVTPEEYIAFCKERHIETPEDRFENLEKKRLNEEKEQRKILEEEAAWRAEQEKIKEERHIAQEEEARKRKLRLKKFGFG